ncbi:MAG: VCBS repeat-containing protein [Planctomycetota bacterium]|nr:MAG: VCBS repeat-containing protein [Planctomycetota bacterium]
MRALSGLLLLLSSVLSAGEIQFETQELDSAVAKVACYAVSLADVNTDGKPDVIAVTENRVLWYENPTWKPRVIIEDQVERDHVCIAPFDIDGDGQIDFALGAGWTKLGTMYWLKRGASLDEKWQVFPIAKEVSTHRMRFGNVLGKDRPQLVVSPLNPSEAPGVRLLAFEIPNAPTADRWPLTVMDESLHRVHNHWHLDLNGDHVDGTLTSSQEGVFLFRHEGSGKFSKRQIGTGTAGTKPEETGAGEVKLGRLGKDKFFLATVEPMHGHSVVVYTGPMPLPEGQLADRQVIDDSFKQGHALGCADLDHDGVDEIIAGHREPNTDGKVAVYYYRASNDAGTKWDRHPLDLGGMASEDLVTGDLNGDGYPEVIAGGRATHNLKIYWNRTAASR